MFIKNFPRMGCKITLHKKTSAAFTPKVKYSTQNTRMEHISHLYFLPARMQVYFLAIPIKTAVGRWRQFDFTGHPAGPLPR